MNELVASDFTSDQIELIKKQIMPTASSGDLSLFVQVCKKTGLDPFTRQIYAVSRKSKNARGEWEERWTYQVSIDGLRLVAVRTGEYEGQTEPQWCGKEGKWETVWLNDFPPVAARVGVYRKGFREALYAVAKFNSYAQYTRENKLTKFWAEMPDLMISKVAESLALRKAFPNELSGLYTTEEMQRANEEPKEQVREVQSTKVVTAAVEHKQEIVLNEQEQALEAKQAEFVSSGKVAIPGAFLGRLIADLSEPACKSIITSFETEWKKDKQKYSGIEYKETITKVRERLKEFETAKSAFGSFSEPTSVIVPKSQ